ncbi:MAG TPA: signal peptide peptidase SppA [Vicinamibacteria bacterium]|jgi:protease-4
MRALLVRILAFVGGLVVVLAVLGLGVAAVRQLTKGRVSAHTVLELNLEGGLLEKLPADPVSQLMLKGRPTLRSVVDALAKAGDDAKVTGVVATLGAGALGYAQAQEVRDAVLAFRAKKKTAVAFAETFGEFGPGNGGYYLASAFDEIYLQPSGDIGLTGLVAQSPFLRGTFEKLGMVPRMDHRYEYKNAMNIFTEKKMTAAHREATGKVLSSVFGQVVKGIAEGRKMGEDEVRVLFDKGPYLGKEAVDAKLVDGLAYRDEVYEKAKSKAGKDAKLLFLSHYLERAGKPHEKGKTVALIYGVGGVSRGQDDYNPLSESFTMGSDSVSAAFREAVDDKEVKAILFRVDSPGGSYVASDTIWRETVRAKKAGKPVVVSMGNVAGSGGYFVAMAADKIVAQPATITGSIGVLGGKILTSGFWDKVGLGWDEVHTSANARIWSTTSDYSPAEWARFEASLDRIYEDFTSKVADGRKLPKEKVLEIAKGRIWSGEDAKGLGLVDELGGLETALRLAKKAASIPDTEDVTLQVFPRPKSPVAQILAGPRENSEPAGSAAALVRAMEAARPVVRQLDAIGFFERPGVLTMPAPEIE